jgi:hypothetical protein
MVYGLGCILDAVGRAFHVAILGDVLRSGE